MQSQSHILCFPHIANINLLSHPLKPILNFNDSLCPSFGQLECQLLRKRLCFRMASPQQSKRKDRPCDACVSDYHPYCNAALTTIYRGSERVAVCWKMSPRYAFCASFTARNAPFYRILKQESGNCLKMLRL